MIKPKVLVVDNDNDMCWLIASILREEDLCVDIAHDVKSALAKIGRHHYEILVLDYKLSGMSGLTVLEKARHIKPPVVTIMISAFGSESVRAKAREFGAYVFLDKPFNINELKKTAKKALIEQRRRCINEANLCKLRVRSSDEHPGPAGFCGGRPAGCANGRHLVYSG